MSISTGHNYTIQEVDGSLCLVNKANGRVVMKLRLMSAEIDFEPHDVVTCQAIFYCSEPE